MGGIRKSTHERGAHSDQTFPRRAWTGQFTRKHCSHLGSITGTAPASEGVRAFVAKGDTWPALRLFLHRGHVGCCDKSRNQHARKHFEETGHPDQNPIRSVA